MSYEPTIWKKGDKVTSTKLNKIENGIQGNDEEVTSIKEDFTSITETHTETETTTTNPEFTMNNGYWWNGAQSSGSYTYAVLSVQEGDVIQCVVTASGYIQQLRFIDAYNGTTRVSSASKQSLQSYTVPSGVNKLYVSINMTAAVYHFNLTRTITISTTLPTGVNALNSAVGRLTKNGFVLSDLADTLASGTEFILAENIDNKKNDTIDVWARFEAFDTITLGHGTGTYGGYVTVDSTYAKVYYNGTVQKTYTHGLTITDFISVHVRHYEEANAYFVITTAGGTWKSTESALWQGCRGKVLAKATMDMTDVRLSTTFADFKKDCIIFGDSYLSVGDPNRWPYHAIKTYGASNLALVGFGGASSANQIVCFRNILQRVKPAWVGWFLGMNDPDTASAVNALWKSCVDEVIDTCNNYGIIPVLATIPCTPTQRNDHKNNYVRNSGYNYVDFAKAVNGEEVGASWYSGMLSSDNVHPTVLGAKALVARLIADMPQVV